MPDARHVIYTSEGDMYVRAADASDEARRILARDGAQYARTWLQDGRTLSFNDESRTNRFDIWLMPGDSDPCPLVAPEVGVELLLYLLKACQCPRPRRLRMARLLPGRGHRSLLGHESQ